MLLSHSLTYALARGLPGAINFLAISIYTRLLNPAAYGEYSLVLAGVALIDAFGIQWLRLGLLRFLPRAGEDTGRLLGTIQALWLFLAAGVTVLLLAFLPFARSLPPGLAVSGLLLFLAQGWFELNLELVRSRLEPGSYGRLALLRSGLSLGLGAAGAFMAGAPGLVAGLAAGIIATYLLLDGHRGWRGVPPRVDGVLLRRLLSYGLPLAATFALGFVVNSSDRFLLGWFLGTDTTGLYSAGYDIAQFTVTMLLTVVNLAAYPLTVRALESEGPEAARRQLADTLFLLLTVGLPATAGLFLLAEPLARVVVSPEFSAAAGTVIPWIAVAALLHGIKAFWVDVAFQLADDTRLQAWVMAGAALLNVLLNLLFIPWFGLVGAVWSTVIVFALALLGSLLLSRRSFGLPRPEARLLGPLGATAAMVVLLLALPEPAGFLRLLLTIGAAATLYGLVFLLLFPAGLRKLRGLLRM